MARAKLECRNCGCRWWETTSKTFLDELYSDEIMLRRCPECGRSTHPHVILVKFELMH